MKFYNIDTYLREFFRKLRPWAQSYQPQIPENFRFLELKILFVVEATPIEEKN